MSDAMEILPGLVAIVAMPLFLIICFALWVCTSLRIVVCCVVPSPVLERAAARRSWWVVSARRPSAFASLFSCLTLAAFAAFLIDAGLLWFTAPPSEIAPVRRTLWLGALGGALAVWGALILVSASRARKTPARAGV
ncbi:MAG: hypothetical protein J0L61_07425 [Planctomycetes bacterium]|nr:hypothetical protein [Planctomycetota bacterium]